MHAGFLQRAALAASIFYSALAQDSVPQDLKSAFATSGVELQVSYTNNAVSGFTDGTTFQKNDVTKEPTFALGDSSGISSTILYTIVLLDTTDDNARTLHYARANFKYNFDITNIDTQDAPLLEYKAPGAFGETGDDRKYTFLMYTNPERKNITSLKLPDEGKSFDVKQFQSDNGLEDADAGIGMVVKLGGGSGASPSSGAAASSTAAAGGSSTAVAATSAGASATEAASQASSAAASSATTGGSQGESSAAGARSTDLVAASSAVQTDGSEAPTSTVLLTSVRPDATGSSTASGSAALSTGAAAAVSIGRTQGGMMVAAIGAFAGIMFW